MLRAVASLSVAPHPTLSEEEVLERQVAILRRQWAEISAWFGAGDSQLRSLDTHLHAAIDWILRGVRRLRERRVQRVNRSSEYRALAALFAGAPDEDDCHADLRRRVRPARRAPPVGAGARPRRRLAGRVVVGRAVRARDRASCAARGAARSPRAGRRRSPTRARHRRWRSTRSCGGARWSASCWTGCRASPARLSALPALDEESFDLLLDALGMAVATGTVGYSDDGTLRLTVLDMGDDLPPAHVRVGDGGVLESPDLLVAGGPGMIDAELEDRLRDARRALLARPLMLAGDPVFGTVRAHAERLRSEFARELGYELVVRASHARLRKRSHELQDRSSRPGSRAPGIRIRGSRSRAATTCSSRWRWRRASAPGRRRRSGCWPRRCARWRARTASSSTSTASTTAAAWPTSSCS